MGSEDVAQRLESGVYLYALDFTRRMSTSYVIDRTWNDPCFARLYAEIARSLVSNLQLDPSLNPNTTLRDAVDSGRVTAEDAAGMTGFERNPVLWQSAVFACASTNPLCDFSRSGTHTDEHPCARCGKSDASYIEVQIRSSDEPATLIITCNGCELTWRV